MLRTSLKPHLKMAYRRSYQEVMKSYFAPIISGKAEKAYLAALDIGIIDEKHFYVTCQSVVSNTRMLYYGDIKSRKLKLHIKFWR